MGQLSRACPCAGKASATELASFTLTRHARSSSSITKGPLLLSPKTAVRNTQAQMTAGSSPTRQGHHYRHWYRSYQHFQSLGYTVKTVSPQGAVLWCQANVGCQVTGMQLSLEAYIANLRFSSVVLQDNSWQFT